MKKFTRVAEYIKVLDDKGYNVSRGYLQLIFKHWNWSFHKPFRVQFEKFSRDNIQRYVNFVVGVQDIPYSRLKFADEGHFDTTGLFEALILP